MRPQPPGVLPSRLVFLFFLLVLVSCDRGEELTCGPGTVQRNRQCLPLPADGGARDCGIRGHAERGGCLPDADAAAPRPSTPWEVNLRLSSGPGDRQARDPQLAIDDLANLHLVYLATTAAGEVRVRVTASRDFGASFATPIILDTDTPAAFAGQAEPAIAASSDGHLFVAYVRHLAGAAGDDLGGAEVWLSISADRGLSFGPPRRVEAQLGPDRPQPSGSRCEHPWVATSPSGELLLTLTCGEPLATASGDQQLLLRSHDHGSTFELVGRLPLETSTPRLSRQASGPPLATADGQLWLALQELEGPASAPGSAIALARFGGGGVELTRILDLAYQRDLTFFARPVLGARQQAGAYIAYRDARNRDVGVWLAHLGADGQLTEAPLPVAAEAAPALQDNPWLDLDDRSGVHLLYVDNRSGRLRIYSRSSADGRRWGDEFLVSDASSDEQPAAGLVVGSRQQLRAQGRRLYAAWTDLRLGRAEVYFSRCRNPLPAPPVPP